MIENLLKYPPSSIEGRNKKVYNYSNESESFNFYSDQFKGDSNFEIGVSVKKENIAESPKEMQEIIEFLKRNTSQNSIVIEIGGSKHQRRSGFPYSIFSNYFPLTNELIFNRIFTYSLVLLNFF